MKSQLKGYIRFLVQNHQDAIISSYVDFLKTTKECDIRETDSHNLDTYQYYKKNIGRYLISILTNKVDEEVQKRIHLWENSELSSAKNFYPVLPEDLFKSYSRLNQIISYYIYKYTNDVQKKHHIATELDFLDDLIDKNIVCSYKEIKLTYYKKQIKTIYLN